MQALPARGETEARAYSALECSCMLSRACNALECNVLCGGVAALKEE